MWKQYNKDALLVVCKFILAWLIPPSFSDNMAAGERDEAEAVIAKE